MPLSVCLTDALTKEEFRLDPGRDIAYFYPKIAQQMIESLSSLEPWANEILKFNDLSYEDLIETVKCFAKFCTNSVEPEIKTPYEAIKASGFLDRPYLTQLIVLAKLGQSCSGAFWAGIRHVTMQGVVPEAIKMVLEAADNLHKEMTNDLIDGSDKTSSLRGNPTLQ